MAKNINWQDHTTNQKKSRFQHLGGWITHISKIVFCLAFVCIAFYYLVLPQIQVNYFYTSTKCLVMGKKLEPLSTKVSNSGFQPKFLALYKVKKEVYTSWAYDVLNNIYTNPDAYKAIDDEIKINHYYICWYDQTNPHKVVLKRGWDHISLVFFLITLIVALTSFTSFYRWLRNRHKTSLEPPTNNKSA